MACTNGATASCIAACARRRSAWAADHHRRAIPPARLGGDSVRRQPGARCPAQAAGSLQRREGRRDAAGLDPEQRIRGARFRDRGQRGMPQPITARRGQTGGVRRFGQARQRRFGRRRWPVQRRRRHRAEQPRHRAGRSLRPTAQDRRERPRDRLRRIRAIVNTEQRQQTGEVGHADRDPRCRGRDQGQRGDCRLDRLGKCGRIEAGGGVMERDEVQHEARQRPGRPCQTDAAGAPCRSSSMRCSRSDSGISRPARSARSASGRIQASAAAARLPAPRPAPERPAPPRPCRPRPRAG